MSSIERDIRDLSINDADLDDELTKQAGLFFYVAERAVMAEAKYKDFKAKVERLAATLSGSTRSEFKKRGEKSTEKMIEEAIILNEDYKKAIAYLNQLFTEKEVLRALRESWYMRKDLLVQLAVKQRHELESIAKSIVKASEDEVDESYTKEWEMK